MTDDATAHKTLDLIAIGRSSVDLYGQQIGCRLEDVASFAKSVGGCPANIAIGTARLGLRSALITRVGAEQMGGFIREQLAREGVGVIMISSELPEILGMTDRVLVLHEGSLTATLNTKETTQEEILNYAAGLGKAKVGTGEFAARTQR